MMFAVIQISRPAGAAMRMALPSTNKVRSQTERMITFPICGRLYGGSSSVKEEGIPFRRVLDNTLDATKVMQIPRRMTKARQKAPRSEADSPVAPPAMKSERMVRIVGNLPLQGTKLLVRMAMMRSLGESMILHPVTPTALQPKPIHIVRACFPQAQHFLKQRSRLKATRGRYPKSSRSVKSGKKIAIGGSITETTQARTRYIPKISGE